MPGTARNREPQPPSCDPEAPCAGSIICPPLELLGGTPPDLADVEGGLGGMGLLRWLPPPPAMAPASPRLL